MKLDYTFYKVGVDPDKDGNIFKPTDMVVLTKESFLYLIDSLSNFNIAYPDDDLTEALCDVKTALVNSEEE